MSLRYWSAVAAYLIPTFPLGFVWHLVTFRAHYARLEMYRDDVLIPLGLLSMAIQALLFAWAYPRLFGTRRDAWLGGAARFAGVFGALAWSFAVLPVAAKYRMASVPDFLALETAFTLVQFLVVSPLVALAWRDAAHAATSSGDAEHALRPASR
jgi:hypothetical protein